MSTTSQPRGAAKWLLGGNALLVYLFFYAPILLLFVFSFSADRNVGSWGGFTFEWYRDLARNEPIQNAISVSLKVAFVSTFVSVVLGTLAALQARAIVDHLAPVVSLPVA